MLNLLIIIFGLNSISYCWDKLIIRYTRDNFCSIVMAGDTLSMVMEPKVNQAVLEIRGSANLSFTDGYCGGKQSNPLVYCD